VINSPQVLMLSGIGAPGELKRLDIGVVAALPGVGENLHDHVLAPVIYKAKRDLPPPSANLLETQMFWKSDSRLLGPDLQPLFMQLPYYPPGFEGPSNAYTLCAGIIRPLSRGSLKLSSSDPRAPLLLDPKYLVEEADVRGLLAAFDICRDLGAAKAYKDWNGGEVLPGPDFRSLEAVVGFLRSAASSYHHQVGTCKMGSDAMAVVDPDLRVYGVEGLRVADASIMPAVPSGNTNAPSIMVGEKAADMIRAAASAG
jgi:choline dehydrogenase